MEMTLLPDRLIKIREARGLNKAEASRLLGLSKMGYLRYERQSGLRPIRPLFSLRRNSGLPRNTLPVLRTTLLPGSY